MDNQETARERYGALREHMQAMKWPDSNKRAFSSKDIELLDRAFEMALAAHTGQERASGEPYIIHPMAVAELLLELGLYNREMIAAALLHDVVEDTDLIDDDIAAEFGDEISALVQGLTKLRDIKYESQGKSEEIVTKEETQAQNYLKMFIAMARDPRVIIVKLADRVHNMRTLQYKNEEKQRDTARETLEIYAPIADMMGIRHFKEELEDRAIRFLDPHACEEIEQKLTFEAEHRADFLRIIQERLRELLAQELPAHKGSSKSGEHTGFRVEGRVKSVHGIYRKMYLQRKDFEEIFDIYAVRVIVDTVHDCWNVFGLIQEIYHPIPNRFKNYIANKKANGYQSIHLTVTGKEAIPFEVQIRTWEMHALAEYGVAAHWKYKQGVQKSGGVEQWVNNVRSMLENVTDADSVEELVSSIKSDIAPPEKVYAMSPKGKAFELPLGATVIDFAYAVHTEIGHLMVGAKVNNRITPLDYKLQTGDVIEILKSSNPGKGPNRDWLKIVKTSQARSKIRVWFKTERKEENISEGRLEVERELRRSFIRLEPAELEEILFRIIERRKYPSLDEFYASIGYGGVVFAKYLPRLREEYQKMIQAHLFPEEGGVPETKRIINDKGVIVEGIDNCLVRFAQCCFPLPGDEIVGYITRGTGLTIHKIGCINVPGDLNTAPEPDRWLLARWSEKRKSAYLGALTIVSMDQTGMMADISGLLKNIHVDISSWQMRPNGDGTSTISTTVGVTGRGHLETVLSKLRQMSGIISVRMDG